MTERILPPTRRRFLVGSAFLAGSSVRPGLRRRAFGAEMPEFVTSIRSLTNPYHAVWRGGANAYARAMVASSTLLVTEGNSEKGLADIRAVIARTGGNMVLNVDPNDTPRRAAHRRGMLQGRRIRRYPSEQARGPASLGFRSLLRAR